MNLEQRALHFLDALEENLLHCKKLAELSMSDFVDDDLMVLAAEAIAVRAGELVKRLARSHPEVFAGNPWRLIAQHRDKVAHDYLDLDREALFLTITRDFLALRGPIADARRLIESVARA